MNPNRRQEVIEVSSDSDDCKIVEARSTIRQPRGPVAPMAALYPNTKAPHSYMTGSGIRHQPAPQQRNPTSTDPRRSQIQSPTYATVSRGAVPSPSRRTKPDSASNSARPGQNSIKSNGGKKDPPIRQIRRCTTCIEDSRCCDGGYPCASCFDPGFPCIYPGESLAPFRSQSTTEVREQDLAKEQILLSKPAGKQKKRVGQTKTTNSSSVPNSAPASDRDGIENERVAQNTLEATLDQSIDSRNAASVPPQFVQNSINNSLQNQPTIAQLNEDEVEINDVSVEEDTDISLDIRISETVDIEQIPSTSWLPKSVDEMQKLISTHEANIKSHREYIVEAQLAGAKATICRNMHIDHEKRGPNPFKKLIEEQSNTSPDSFTLDVKIKPKRGDFATLKLSVGLLGDDTVAHIPEYKSIGRLRSPFLARNVHALKYVPYHSGIEDKDLSQRAHDLETHFKDHSAEEFRRQRECLELVYQWSDTFDQIMQDVQISPAQLWKWLGQNTQTKCQKCQIPCGRPPKSLPVDITFTEEEKQRCNWFSEVFTKTIRIGIWHFISQRPGQLVKNNSASRSEGQLGAKTKHALCSLCFTHNCMIHGSYVDKVMTKKGEAIINDPEERNNERRRTILSVGTRSLPHHICGLYCLGSDFPGLHEAHKILGIDENDELNGLRNEKVKMIPDLGPFHGKEPCKNTCFINHEDRPLRPNITQNSLDNTSKTTQQLLHSMTKLYSNHVRLPCMISKVTQIDCMTAFFLLLQTYKSGHTNVPAEESSIQTTLDPRKMPTKAGMYNTMKSASLENRKAWAPCSHDGPCASSNSGCYCAREQVHCEKSCGCPDGCRRRFRGCRCKKKCFLDDRCECYAANRECDPQLCHDCGVEEVLDPSNKYREDVRIARCRNNRLQLDLPPRTVKGMSEVQGWGLFLGEDLPSNTFVGEYKGENVSASESDRRGAIYAYVSQEYLFNLNKDHQLDGSRFGNKTRFINNSKAKEFINVFPKVMFVNGVTRIGLFTNRAMKAGEELLYDYGYPAELVQGEFWEKHERAIEHNGVVTPIAKPKFRPRMAKNAVDTPGGEDEAETPIRKVALVDRQKKRKRLANIEFEDSDATKETIPTVRVPTIRNSADSESSEYEESSQGNDVSSIGSVEEEEEESEDESEDELAKPTKPIDRRRGGEAQRKAALTRKLNKQRATE